jgi:hypothetical protein
LGGVVALAALLGASTESTLEPLACQEINVAQAGQGDLAAATPEEAALTTEWLDAIGIPRSVKHLVGLGADEASGIVPIPASAAVAAGDVFQVRVDAAVVAQLTIAQAEDDSYYVGEVAYC